ncbi:hypothetical protein [Duganella sp. P38]|uniref:hypothetical protein n=1 Tax=Duganella sp. P38 TaxID=3423949 RepID=UPI003D79DB5E
MFDLFGGANYVKTDEFDSFKKAVAEQIAGLKSEIALKVTDSEELARNAAENAVAAELRVKGLEDQFKNALTALNQFQASAKEELDSLSLECNKARETSNILQSSINEVQALYSSVLAAKSEVDAAKESIHSDIDLINEALETSKTLPDSVDEIQGILKNSEGIYANISDLLSHSASKKGEIDELRDKILGKDMEVDGSNVHVDGIKDKLEKSYFDVESRVKNLESEIQIVTDAVNYSHEKQLEKNLADFEHLVSRSNARIDEVDSQLKDLLPGAMAAGLSAAYAKKKDDETNSLIKSEEKFQKSIFAMAAISGIPLIVDTYLLFGEKIGIIKVIQDTPNLLLAILPLYLPALWIAVSLNKKINLSKRLIEEYTHKEVLGKTFAGISNQIDTLNSGDGVREELRTRLLFNLLQVSAENPGKLITDYNKTDHPLMSVLDNSKKLSDSMEALSKIPGLEAITKGLAARAAKKFEETAKDVANGINANTTLEDKDESDNKVDEKKE